MNKTMISNTTLPFIKLKTYYKLQDWHRSLAQRQMDLQNRREDSETDLHKDSNLIMRELMLEI